MQSLPKGFGFFDASQYEPKPDNTAWIIKDILPRNSFGFVAGPAKGNASPHGGKSVLERKMALSILTGESFLDYEVLIRGRVMFVNLDEDPDKQVRLYYRMTKGTKIPGYLISKALSCRLPEQIDRLEEDIKNAMPLVVIIDPLQRTLGNREVRNQGDVGPIINELKRLMRTYNCTIIVNHHSNKDGNRDKDSTPSWLSGSNDLDAAWDFCLCVEYSKSDECMHLWNFQKEKAPSDAYYEAEIINGDEIVDLLPILAELRGSSQARQIYNAIKLHNCINVKSLLEFTGISRGSLYYQIKRYQVLKNLTRLMAQDIDNKEVKLSSDFSKNENR